MADDDLVPPGDDPSARGGLVCEFCQCSLAKSGGVLTVSTRAKKIRRMEDDLERGAAALVDAQATIATLREELEALKARVPAPAAPSSRRDWLGD